jgi:hypothetical protein
MSATCRERKRRGVRLIRQSYVNCVAANGKRERRDNWQLTSNTCAREKRTAYDKAHSVNYVNQPDLVAGVCDRCVTCTSPGTIKAPAAVLGHCAVLCILGRGLLLQV